MNGLDGFDAIVSAWAAVGVAMWVGLIVVSVQGQKPAFRGRDSGEQIVGALQVLFGLVVIWPVFIYGVLSRRTDQ